MAIDNSKSIRFMVNNLLETGYAALSVSSEKFGFPFYNALDPSQRTKLFKFGGRFLIEAGVNDKIYINGNTYTVAADNYQSGTDLANAINDVIVGAICFYDPFTSKDFYLAGDGAPMTLNLSNNVTAIWQTIGFTTGVDSTTGASVEKHGDMVRLHWPNEEISIDFGYLAPIGFIGIIGDLAEEFKIPEGAVVRIQGNTVNSFVAPPLDKIIPWTSTGSFKFIDDIADSAWRYVKLTITCPTHNKDLEIGYLYIGEYSKLPDDRNVSTGFELEFEDNSDSSDSDDGQMFFNDKTPIRVFRSLQVDLARPEASAYLKRIYKLKQKSIPFFVALDPKMYLSHTFDEHLALVRFVEPPKYKHVARNLFEFGFELREAL